LGKTFNLTLTVNAVTNLWSWKAGISWDPRVLNLTSSPIEGNFFGGGTLFAAAAPNYTRGILPEVYDILLSSSGQSGSGNLAIFTFKIVGYSVASAIGISNAVMLDPSTPHNKIPFTTVNATFTLPPPDIAVIAVKPSKTVVGRGLSMSINATVENLGDYTETFNVAVYANATQIGNYMTVTDLSPAAVTSIILIWNVAGSFPLGNYNISAYAGPVPGETDIANNRLSGGWVFVSIAGDLTGPKGVPDGKVNMFDVAVMAGAFGSYPSSPRWNPNADLTGPKGVPDGKVNMYDVAVMAGQFGKHA
jgi:hypothetical protein